MNFEQIKYIYRLWVAIMVVVILSTGHLSAQIIHTDNQKAYTDSLRNEWDKGPYFTLFKDNYFLAGTTVNSMPSRTNSDVKFQISISQRLTKSVLPGNTYLFLAYTQKCFWNVFEKSLPMHDMNFNPGIGLCKPLFNKDRYIGKVTLLVEHESNGKDSIQSRSWNRVSLGANIYLDENVMVHGKVWVPIIDGKNNKDILDYCGIYQSGVTVTSPNKRLGFALTLVKRRGWSLDFNTIFEFSWRVRKRDNQFFFLQYYNGYGENLLDYNRFHNRLRIGFVIKPKFFSEY